MADRTIGPEDPEDAAAEAQRDDDAVDARTVERDTAERDTSDLSDDEIGGRDLAGDDPADTATPPLDSRSL